MTTYSPVCRIAVKACNDILSLLSEMNDELLDHINDYVSTKETFHADLEEKLRKFSNKITPIIESFLRAEEADVDAQITACIDEEKKRLEKVVNYMTSIKQTRRKIVGCSDNEIMDIMREQRSLFHEFMTSLNPS